MPNRGGGVQIDAARYRRAKYNTLGRFISYYYQIDSVLKLPIESLLEIGVGSKTVSEYLKRVGVLVTTADFDPNVAPDVVADVRRLPFDDNQFDAVMACEILEHIPFDEAPTALRELRRVSRRYVIISLPYRSTYFEIAGRWPLIRTITKNNFFNFTLRWPLIFPGFKESGQHYWEIDRKEFKLKRVRGLIGKEFRILDEFSPVLDKYHYFFILEVRS